MTQYAVTVTVTYTLHTQLDQETSKNMVKVYWDDCAARVQGTVDDFEFIDLTPAKEGTKETTYFCENSKHKCWEDCERDWNCRNCY